jgi:hypothetical protein
MRSKEEILRDFEALKKEIESLPDDKQKGHWPGMFIPEDEEINYYPSTVGSCKTQKEADWLESYFIAKKQVIDLLLEKNGGDTDWIDWRDKHQVKCIIRGWNHSTQKFYFVNDYTVQTKEPWFIARHKNIWLQVIEELGGETVRLALFPEYKSEEEL